MGTGQVIQGIRLFGNESKLTIYSMRSGAVNSLQVEEPTEEFQNNESKLERSTCVNNDRFS